MNKKVIQDGSQKWTENYCEYKAVWTVYVNNGRYKCKKS